MVSAVAVFNLLVTKPYWNLMQSEKHSDVNIPPYVKKLLTFLDSAEINIEPVFEEFVDNSLKLSTFDFQGEVSFNI